MLSMSRRVNSIEIVLHVQRTVHVFKHFPTISSKMIDQIFVDVQRTMHHCAVFVCTIF